VEDQESDSIYVAEARSELGLTQKEFGALLGVTSSSIARIEQGVMRLTYSRYKHIGLTLIANKLAKSCEDLRKFLDYELTPEGYIHISEFNPPTDE